MKTITEIENRITELENELRQGLFPITRADYAGRENPAQSWLDHLENIKREKDNNSTVWQKMRNWD